MGSLTVGASIYIAMKPLFKIFLNAGTGFMLARKGLLPVETCQKLSIIIINVFLPALVFSNVVETLDRSNLKSIGTTVLTGFMYEACGLLFALIVYYTTPNPKKWLGGITAAGIFTNTSDLPIAYVTTITTGSLFPSSDGSVGTAYSIMMLIVFITTMFNFGGFKLIARDFKEKHQKDAGIVTDGLPGTIRDLKALIHETRKHHHESTLDIAAARAEKELREFGEDYGPAATDMHFQSNSPDGSNNDDVNERPVPLRRVSSYGTSAVSSAVDTHSTISRTRTRSGTIDNSMDVSSSAAAAYVRKPSDALQDRQNLDDVVDSFSVAVSRTDSHALRASRTKSRESTLPVSDRKIKKALTLFQKFVLSMKKADQAVQRCCDKYHVGFVPSFIKNFARPPSLSLIISLIVTMIPKLRSLFYINGVNNNGIRLAPDGAPVLDFVMDFATFIGKASVPCGLLMLGATLSRIQLKSLPKGFWKSMVLMTILKLAILPMIAVVWVEFVRRIGWISMDDPMAALVLIVSSGVPVATSQIYLTAIFTPPDHGHLEMDCLAAYVIAQYAFLPLSIGVLVTYTLKNVLEL